FEHIVAALALGPHERAALNMLATPRPRRRTAWNTDSPHAGGETRRLLTGSQTGKLTFVVTALEGSTRLCELYPHQMRHVTERCDQLIADEVAKAGGVVVGQTEVTDNRLAVFSQPGAALAAVCAIQLALDNEPWPTPEPIRIQIGV